MMRDFQIVWKKGKPYIRIMPYTVEEPTEAQKDIRDIVRYAVKLASSLSDEEVADLVGGEVAGKNLVLYKGSVLPKQSAMVKYLLEGVRSPKSKAKIPKWMSYTLELFEKLKEEKEISITK